MGSAPIPHPHQQLCTEVQKHKFPSWQEKCFSTSVMLLLNYSGDYTYDFSRFYEVYDNRTRDPKRALAFY